MFGFAHRFVRFFGIACAIGAAFISEAQPLKRAVTPDDCVRTRRIFEGQLELSPGGSSVAYIVVAPDINSDKNRYLLYVRDLKNLDRADNGRLLLETSAPLTCLKWPSQSKSLFLMDQEDGVQSIKEIDPVTAISTTVISAVGIGSFSVDAGGSVVVFSTIAAREKNEVGQVYDRFGYPVIFGKGLLPPSETKGRDDRRFNVYVARRQAHRGFDVATMVNVLSGLRDVSALTLSPNGRFLTLNYKADGILSAWRSNPYVRWCMSEDLVPDQLGLYDFKTTKLQMGFDSPAAGWEHPVVWADDSHAFTVNALSPVGSEWEKRDIEVRTPVDGESWPFTHTHTFARDVTTMKIAEVAEHPAIWFMNQVVFWRATDGPILLRKDDRTYEWLKPGNPDWSKAGDSLLSVGAVNIYSAMYIQSARLNAASDGERIVGVLENNINPPNLFVQQLSNGQVSVLTDLNPELRDVALQPVEGLQWRDRHGFHCSGLLIKPLGYVAGKHYPLVIMTKTWWEHYFLSDTEYHTAFAPQPLASVGFLVLLAQERPAEFERNRSGTYPGHDPGHMGEAEELKNIIEGAVHELTTSGLADPDNIGIMGFSTTSWKTDVLLTHYGLRFRAASSADSGLWNYGLYWSSNSAGIMHDSEEYLGGAPYGKTFSNWRKFSPAFNASRVKTPILMEYITSGRQEIDGLEFFVALRKQNQAAELFFYPRGDHVLENPSERVSSLQRNLDWFRFWMQDYVGQSPFYDPGQFSRWRALKEELSAQEKNSRSD